MAYGPPVFRPTGVSTRPPRLNPAGSAPPMGGSSGLGAGIKVKFAKGGSTASKRADGCATKGKTKGRFV
jgi:hypothetical protein